MALLPRAVVSSTGSVDRGCGVLWTNCESWPGCDFGLVRAWLPLVRARDGLRDGRDVRDGREKTGTVGGVWGGVRRARMWRAIW